MDKQDVTLGSEELEKIDLGDNITAGWYLHGICGFFALELHKKYGYEIEVATETPIAVDWQITSFHVYCKDHGQYIDARGRFSDKKRFLEEFEDFFDTPGFVTVTGDTLSDFLLQAMTEEEFQVFSQKARELIETQAIYVNETPHQTD